MSIITIVGAGMMGSAIGFPARENGHEVRLVGTHLDREIIDHAKKTNTHLTLKRPFPEGFKFYQIEQLEEAMQGADVLVCGKHFAESAGNAAGSFHYQGHARPGGRHHDLLPPPLCRTPGR